LVSEDDAVMIFLAKHSLSDAYAIIEKNEKGKLKIEPIKEEEIERAIKNLKPGKSPDIDGISAEHYKNAIDELKPLILHITKPGCLHEFLLLYLVVVMKNLSMLYVYRSLFS
jgi:hypothetical protein